MFVMCVIENIDFIFGSSDKMIVRYNVKRHNSTETETLVTGYIRQNVLITIVPEIIKLCQQFYEPLSLWSLTGDILHQFKHAKTSEVISSKVFDYNNFKFIFEVYPNGGGESQKGFVSLRYTLLSFPDNIDTLIFYNEYFCLETNREYKNTSRFQRNAKTNEWLKYTLRVQDCMELKSLTFGLHLDLLSIDYNNNYSLGACTKYMSHPKINAEISYDWLISGKLLDSFRNCLNGRHFQSECFGINDNFCLICFPNGYKPERIGNLSLGIKLLRLPNKVSRIDIEYGLKTLYDGAQGREFRFRSNARLSYANSVIGWRNGTFETQILETIETNLWFKATIKITEMYDMNDHIIDKSQWWGKYTCNFVS